MDKNKKKEIETSITDQPVPVIMGSGKSVIQLSEDQMRNLAEHFVDSSGQEMY